MQHEQHEKPGKEYYLALLFLILAVIFWGYSFISTKMVLKVYGPASIAFFRQVIAAVALIIWLGAARGFTRVSRRDWLPLTVSAFLGIVLYFLFENTGMLYTTASNASLIVAAVPIFTMFTETFFFKLKITWKMIACLLLSIAGVYLVISINGKLDFSSARFKGNLMVVGAMVCWVFYTIVNKKLSEKYPSLMMTMLQSCISVVLFVPWIIKDIPRWQWPSWGIAGNLVYLGVFCSAMSYFFYIYAIKRLGATIGAAFLNLIPVVTVISGFLVLQEGLAVIQIIGMALIMFSLYQISAKPKRSGPPQKVAAAPESDAN